MSFEFLFFVKYNILTKLVVFVAIPYPHSPLLILKLNQKKKKNKNLKFNEGSKTCLVLRCTTCCVNCLTFD